MGCDFRYSEVFLGEVRHNQFHQFFHEYFIPRVVGYLLDVQFFCLFEVFNTLFPALLDILYQQFQILGVERFGDIRIGSSQITFRMIVFISLCSQEDNGDMAGRYVLLDTFREFQSVHHRHHQIRYNEVGQLFGYLLAGFRAVIRPYNIIFLAEYTGEVIIHFFVVLHNHNRFPGRIFFFVGQLFGNEFDGFLDSLVIFLYFFGRDVLGRAFIGVVSILGYIQGNDKVRTFVDFAFYPDFPFVHVYERTRKR